MGSRLGPRPALVAWLVMAVVLLAISGSSCGGASPAGSTGASAGQTGTPATAAGVPPGAVTVVMKNIAFVPADVTVKVGQTVAWVNEDQPQHDVVANGGAFKSALLDLGQVFTFTFTKAGTYPYYCAVHPQMKGIVTVQP